MNKIVVLLGASGAGKDHRVKHLYYNFEHIEPIAPWRRFLESTFGLDEGELDTQDGKSKFIPNSKSTTLGEYMLSMYHTHQEMGVSISEPLLLQQLSKWFYDLDLPDNAVITSVRTVGEAAVIYKFAKEHGLDLELEVLYNRGSLKTSDLNIIDIAGYLSRHASNVSFIDNGENING